MASSPAKTIRPGFLIVPAELRLEIYDHYFRSCEDRLSVHHQTPASSVYPSLMHLSRFVSGEASTHYRKYLNMLREYLAWEVNALEETVQLCETMATIIPERERVMPQEAREAMKKGRSRVDGDRELLTQIDGRLRDTR